MTSLFTYGQAIAALEDALKFGIDPSLEPIKRMCTAMGNPQRRFKCIQVAGSNGKTSVARISAALCRQAGYKVGLYTSPHLVKYPERIEIDCEVVSDQQFADAVQAALRAAEECGYESTEFELLTAAALWLFAREGVEVAVLECGLGGRWDATSVADADVAVITGVALEHTAILGDTVEAIAAEKAAIIKPGSKAVLAHGIAAAEVFEERACEVGAPLAYAAPAISADYANAMEHLPRYQYMNAATALLAAETALDGALAGDVVERALATVVIPGRFETLRTQPLLMIDAAHNPQSAQVLAEEISRRFPAAGNGRLAKPTLLLGVLADKDVRGVVEAVAPLFENIVVTASSSPRAISAEELAGIVEEATGRRPQVEETVAGALSALAHEDVLATGSITIAGEAKGVFLGQL